MWDYSDKVKVVLARMCRLKWMRRTEVDRFYYDELLKPPKRRPIP